MSRRKLERLLNLTMALMATSRYLSVEEVGRLVEGYDPGDSEESQVAFRRMFERDKDDLRELGIPLELGSNTKGFDDEPGYRIKRRDYALPEIALEPDEAAALGLAARLWSSAQLADAGASALRKLAAAGVDQRPPPSGLEPRVDATEPAFPPCLAAVREGRGLEFPYRASGAAGVTRRRVQPWGVVSWHGRWYVVGHDLDRGAVRVFRLSRVAGPVRVVGTAGSVRVPPGVDLRAAVEAAEPSGVAGTARLAVRTGAGHSLRREALAVTPGPAGGDDVVELAYADLERLADRLVGHGDDVLVLEPPALRELVVRRLEAVLAGSAAPAATRGTAAGPGAPPHLPAGREPAA